NRRPSLLYCGLRRLLDFAFDEFDVFFCNRIVFLHLQLLGHRPRVLLGDVIEPGVGAGDELDLGGDGLGHDNPRGVNAVGAEPRPTSRWMASAVTLLLLNPPVVTSISMSSSGQINP